MEEKSAKVPKTALWKSILFSFLACLGGALVLALISALTGSTYFFIPMAFGIVALFLFTKYCKRSWGMVVFAFLWCTFMLTMLNVIATYIESIIYVANYLECSFAESYDLILSTPELKSALSSDIGVVVGFTIFGCIIGLAYLIAAVVKEKKQAKAESDAAKVVESEKETVTVVEEKKEEKTVTEDLAAKIHGEEKDFKTQLKELQEKKGVVNPFNRLVENTQKAIAKFKKDKDSDALDKALKEERKFVNSLSDEEYTNLRVRVAEEKIKENQTLNKELLEFISVLISQRKAR